MAIAHETQSFARCLVATEEHGRRAMLALMEMNETAAAKELEDSLKHARKLPKHLMEWTAEVANPIRGASHINMACYLGAFAKGTAGLKDALAVPASTKSICLLSDALEAICGAHEDLVEYCCKKGCKVIEIPEIPTTKDGGGR